MAIVKLSTDRKINLHYTAPSEPNQNAFVASFYKKPRDQRLNETPFGLGSSSVGAPLVGVFTIYTITKNLAIVFATAKRLLSARS